MKILITGGAGFIGSYFVDLCLRNEHEVIVVDNLSSGKESNIPSSAILLPIDIRSSELENVFNDYRPEYVVHLAAQRDVQSSIHYPVEDTSVNILGTVNLLELCKKYSAQKLVFTSSAAVYGNNSFLPLTEEHPVNPTSPYGLSKLAAEQYIKLYGTNYGISYSILRLANVYGPKQIQCGSTNVISNFITSLINDEYVEIYGDGTQTRDFIYVEDVVNAIFLSMLDVRSQNYNVSSQNELSINEVEEILSDLAKAKKRPMYQAEKIGDIKRSCLSNSKIKKHLSWEPRISIQNGLRKCWDYEYERCYPYSSIEI